jgi:ribosomal subunit interface protein
MQVPLEVKFHNVDHSPAVEDAIRKRVDKLERFVDDIISCRAVVELPHKRRHKGDIYHVFVDVEVPGSEIVVSRNPGRLGAHVDPFVAVNDAFDAAERQLQDYARVRRRETKVHVEPPRGRIVELHRERGFGRIEAVEGSREIYFHRNSVVGGFDDLEVGFEVAFGEEAGDEGPQATFVRVIGPPGEDRLAGATMGPLAARRPRGI